MTDKRIHAVSSILMTVENSGNLVFRFRETLGQLTKVKKDQWFEKLIDSLFPLSVRG